MRPCRMISGRPRFSLGLCFAACLVHSVTAYADGAGTNGPAAPPPAASADATDPLLARPEPPARRLTHWSEVVDGLRSHSAELASAVAAVRRAEADGRAALAPLYGYVRAQGQATQNLLTKDITQVVGVTASGAPLTQTTTSPTPRIGSFGVTAGVTLVAPQAWEQAKTARLNVDLAEDLLGDQRRILVEKAAGTIVAVVAAERVAEINRIGLKAALERDGLAKRRLSLGGGTVIDVVRAAQDVEGARSLVVTGDESLRQAREALGLALGLAEPVGVDASFRLDDAVRDVIQQCPSTPLDARADVTAARRRIALAEQVGREATRAYAPTLGVESVVAYGTDSSALSMPVQWNVLAVLGWDLWDGGLRQATIRRGDAQRDQAKLATAGLTRDITIAATRADRAVSVATEARAIAERARNAASEEERLARIAFTTGAGTSLELVTAGAQLRNQEIQLALRDYDVVKTRLLALIVRARCDY